MVKKKVKEDKAAQGDSAGKRSEASKTVQELAEDEDIVVAMLEDVDDGEEVSNVTLIRDPSQLERPKSAADVEYEAPEPGSWREVASADRPRGESPSHALTPHNERYHFDRAFNDSLMHANSLAMYRFIAFAIATVGAIMVIWAGRADAVGDPVPGYLAPLGWFLVLSGLLAGMMCHFLGRVQWGATTLMEQTEERILSWQRLALVKKIAAYSAWTFAASLFVLVLGYQFLAGAPLAVIGGAGAVIALAALVSYALASARLPSLRRSHLQTSILAMLEEEGIGPQGAMDPRVSRVMEAMDGLLADLPDSAIQRFLETEVSNEYLDLLEEARRQHE